MTLVAVEVGGRVAEVGTARPLQQVAANRRHVAQLRRRGKQQRLRDGGRSCLDDQVGGDPAHRRERADHDGAVLLGDVAHPRQPADVDQELGADDVALRQVEHRRAAGQQHRPVPAGPRSRLGERIGSGVVEIHHAASWRIISAAAARTAVTMLLYAPQRHRLPAMNSRISASDPA